MSHVPKERVLISQARIQQRIRTLARDIDDFYKGKELIVIGVLNGSILFLADLVRHLRTPLSLDSISTSSYGLKTYSSKKVLFHPNLKLSIKGHHVLLVDDILDTGRTMKRLLKFLESLHPKSVELCILLRKRVKRVAPIRARFVGFDIPNRFVFGYGLDIAEKFRNLPYIAYRR
jgi:hypoxanthine phosphoribosyltransferase